MKKKIKFSCNYFLHKLFGLEVEPNIIFNINNKIPKFHFIASKDNLNFTITVSEETIRYINFKIAFGEAKFIQFISVIYLCLRTNFFKNAYFCLGDCYNNLISNKIVISFCSNNLNSILIPDFQYIKTLGHISDLENLRELPKPSNLIAYYIGSILGIKKDRGNLVNFSINNSDILKAYIGSNKRKMEETKKLLLELSIYGQSIILNNLIIERVPKLDMYNFLVQVDVDGVSNSWNGFFCKLFSGRPLLKIKSSRGFKQWYYDRLKPDYHYFDVKSDLSNFREKYYQALEEYKTTKVFPGREFISKMNYDDELQLAADKISFYFK